jgi:sec-independent protein translocase protein TatA
VATAASPCGFGRGAARSTAPRHELQPPLGHRDRAAKLRTVLAFLPSLGWQEIFLLVVIGLLLFGRDLPSAGRKLGKVVAQLKRTFHDFKDQMDRDESLREVRKSIEEAKREVDNVTTLPRAVADPGRALRDLTHEAMSVPLPPAADDHRDDASPGTNASKAN